MRNENLKKKIGNLTPQSNYLSASRIEKPNTINLQGHEANKMDKWQSLISLLNTSKLEPQFYRSENETAKYLQFLIDKCASEDPFLAAQCVVYSRNNENGMRTINHLAAVLLAPYVSGQEWTKRFYSTRNKKEQTGGCVGRLDDMKAMFDIYKIINKTTITNAMKKGFRMSLESYSPYYLLKYKKDAIDIANLVRPNPNKGEKVSIKLNIIRKEFEKAKEGTKRYNHLRPMVQMSEKWNNDERRTNLKELKISVISAIMLGIPVLADTWEANNSEAGQIVASAVKQGNMSQSQAKQVLDDAKEENWKGLLEEGKLGILAALRNIRSILKVTDEEYIINSLCNLLNDEKKILQGKIMPHQFDMANEVLNAEFNSAAQRDISSALAQGFEAGIPNLSELRGRNLILLDASGSMQNRVIVDPNRKLTYQTTCQNKACLLAAALAKGLNADIIIFGGIAKYLKWNPNVSVFELAKSFYCDLGATNLARAWDCASNSGIKYDRVFILSDYECNKGNTYEGYKRYVEKCGDPNVYSIDLASYGTAALAGPKVRYYFGYGFQLFDDIANDSFKPDYHLNLVKQIKI